MTPLEPAALTGLERERRRHSGPRRLYAQDAVGDVEPGVGALDPAATERMRYRLDPRVALAETRMRKDRDRHVAPAAEGPRRGAPVGSPALRVGAASIGSESTDTGYEPPLREVGREQMPIDGLLCGFAHCL